MSFLVISLFRSGMTFTSLEAFRHCRLVTASTYPTKGNWVLRPWWQVLWVASSLLWMRVIDRHSLLKPSGHWHFTLMLSVSSSSKPFSILPEKRKCGRYQYHLLSCILLIFQWNVHGSVSVGREKKTADSVICCLRWNPLDVLDYDFMEPCHVVAGRKLPCLLSVYYMPDTLLDAENSMTDTRVSAFREFSVVWGRQRGKHREAALIYQMSKSWELQRIVVEVQEWRPIGFLFSQKKHQVNLSGS